MKKNLPAVIFLLLATVISRGADAPLFPFVLPWDDATPDITNMSSLLDKPAGGRGFVVVTDGHLYEGGKRFRIFGVNTVFGASFPTHADAEKVAARMAKLGINCVRFHHMDNQQSPMGIWSADMKTFDPEQLDKLDYFIAQLKKNGIYADLNLHVSRIYPDMPKWEGMPGYFKGVDNFYPPMIAMQRDYARQLLTHVNPYTKTAYIDEPAVAIIEINNENGLICEWQACSLDNMAGVYRDELGKLWNQWLSKKYPAKDSLQKAWGASAEPLGAETLKEPDFEKSAAPGSAWMLEQHDGAHATATLEDGSLHIAVQHEGAEGWHVQLAESQLSFSKEKHYTVTFRARADAPRRIAVVASQNHAPWNSFWSVNVQLTTEWQQFRFTFQPDDGDENARLVFSNLGAEKGNYWFANASLRTGGITGLREGEQAGSIPLFKKSEFGMRSIAAQTDWMTFLYDTEEGYWTGMQRFLKEDLKARSLIVGTANGYSPPSIQAKLDVVDVHAYWQHPHFPRKQWDMKDWTVKNIPMAGEPDGGTIPGLAERRVAGKPLICTEYNEAAPNTHAGETFLLVNAYAALQDWDGIFVFAYSHRHDDWDSRRIGSFFDIDQHPVKLVTLPAAVSLFLRGDVSKARNVVTVPVSLFNAISKSLRSGPWWDMGSFGMDKQVPLQSEVQIDTNPSAQTLKKFFSIPVHTAISIGSEPVTASDSGELMWRSDKGSVTINTPRSKAFIGKNPTGPVVLDGITIEPLKNRQDWSAITITAMDVRDLQTSSRILITATGYAENTGMRWATPEKNSLIDGDWGEAPSLVEGIPAKITLPFPASRIKAWSLDEKGQRLEEIKVQPSGTNTVLEISPAYRTLWYEVETGATAGDSSNILP
ncbi:MAG: carbohydrate binding domain-containing protein [Chthoniobacteraceae bacterium]